MKKNILSKSFIITALLLSTSYAKNTNFIEIGLGIKNTDDRFIYQDNISDSEKSKTEVFPKIQFAYNYDLNETYTAYVKAQNGELNIGSNYKFDNSKIDFGFLVNLGSEEEWQNSFDLENNDKKSEVSEKGIYVSYSMPIMENLNTSIKYQGTTKEYKDDKMEKSLLRDGKKHVLSINNKYKSYLLNFNYELYKADGKASSYKQYEIEAGKIFKVSQNMSIFALVNLGNKKYDALNQNEKVNKKVDASIYGAAFKIKYNEPLNYKNTFISFVSKYENTNANSDFYDKKNTMGMISLGYNF